MIEINKKISQFIEEQFPDFYRDGRDITETERSVVIDFVEAYYEYLEQDHVKRDNFLASREMFEYRDVDTTLDEFINYFKSKYLNEFPQIKATNERVAIKNIIDLYRAKGSEKSLKLLIRLLYGVDSSVYYPAEAILKPSTSTWVQPQYIEVTRTDRNINFVGQTIESASGTTAFVESLVRKRVNGYLFDVFFVSDIRNGPFAFNEPVAPDGVYVGAPKINGSLSAVTIIDGGSGYSVGDILEVRSGVGNVGKVRVTSVRDVSDQVDFSLEDGGFGYNVDDLEVLTSDAVLFTENNGLVFEDLTTATQTLFNLSVAGNTDSYSEGDVIEIFDQDSNLVANGYIASVSSGVIVFQLDSGSMQNIYTANLASNSSLLEGETIESESEWTLDFISANGTFQVGEMILQKDAGSYAGNVAYGDVVTESNTTITVTQAWGDFLVGKEIVGQTSGATATIDDANQTSVGVTGTVLTSNLNSTTIEFESIETFVANTSIRGETTKVIETLDAVSLSGPAEYSVGNTAAANIDSFSDVSASGEVVGQTSAVVGLSGNSYPFYVISSSNTVVSEFTNSGNTYSFNRIGRGSGAGFEVSGLNPDTTELAEIGVTLIGDSNVEGVPYLDIIIGTSENSGVSHIATVANTIPIANTGSGYDSNTEIVLSGGGRNGEDPYIPARLEVSSLGANGEILEVSLLEQGAGYYSVPSVSINGAGSGAEITISLSTGYGFPAYPFGNFTNAPIGDMIATETKTIGEIAGLTSFNPGTNYDTAVFTKIIDRDIQRLKKYDYVLSYSSIVGVFEEDEIIETSSGAKARIESIDFTNSRIIAKRLTVNVDIKAGDTVIGQTLAGEAVIGTIDYSTSEDESGLNAVIDSTVVLNSGIIQTVEVVDSGFGYINGTSILLYDDDENVGSGIATATTEGISAGYWSTTESHMNQQKIHDNDFYQEYSYQIVSGLSLDNYADAVRDLIHVAGTKLFGKVESESFIDQDYDITIVNTITPPNLNEIVALDAPLVTRVVSYSEAAASPPVIPSWSEVELDTLGAFANSSPTVLTVPSGINRVRLRAVVKTQDTWDQNIYVSFRKNGSGFFGGSVNTLRQGLDSDEPWDVYIHLESLALEVTPGDEFSVRLNWRDGDFDFGGMVNHDGVFFEMEAIEDDEV